MRNFRRMLSRIRAECTIPAGRLLRKNVRPCDRIVRKGIFREIHKDILRIGGLDRAVAVDIAGPHLLRHQRGFAARNDDSPPADFCLERNKIISKIRILL